MRVYEIHDTKTSLKKWKIIHNDGTSEFQEIGETFVSWFNSLNWFDAWIQRKEIEISQIMRLSLAFDRVFKAGDETHSDYYFYSIVYDIVESIGITSDIKIEPFYDYLDGQYCYGKLYTLPDDKIDSFVLFDVLELLKDKPQKLKMCKEPICKRFFIQTKKNQLYCPLCRSTHIPEKRKQQTDSQRLYTRIYNKLNLRVSYVPQNKYLIQDLDSFKTQREAFRESHTKAEYVEWLRAVDDAISISPKNNDNIHLDSQDDDLTFD